MVEKNWEDYCPVCNNYDDSSGACSELHFNVKSYPKKFAKKCNAKHFNLDKDKKIKFLEEKAGYLQEQVEILDSESSEEISNEGMTGGEWLGAFFCTPYGLIKYFDWKKTYPRKSSQVCTLYIIVFIINIILTFIRIAIESSSY